MQSRRGGEAASTDPGQKPALLGWDPRDTRISSQTAHSPRARGPATASPAQGLARGNHLPLTKSAGACSDFSKTRRKPSNPTHTICIHLPKYTLRHTLTHTHTILSASKFPKALTCPMAVTPLIVPHSRHGPSPSVLLSASLSNPDRAIRAPHPGVRKTATEWKAWVQILVSIKQIT